MGSFVGYLRRPKSSAAGLVAQFFGENGEDADVITALHLTKFLESSVRVTVWMMKDKDGRVMKKNGEYPKITEFVGTIRRPVPSLYGQLAQFFGANGANSDAINILNNSSYVDALVFIQMHQAAVGMTAADMPVEAPDASIEDHADRMTPLEAQEFKRVQKRAGEAMKLLKANGFFRQESVLAALGRADDMRQWVSQQYCCHPGEAPCDLQPVVAWDCPGLGRYRAIPLCITHKDVWEAGNVILADGATPLAYAQTQAVVFQQRWAQQALAEALKIPAGHIPTPGALYTWAVSHNLQAYVPATYKAFLA